MATKRIVFFRIGGQVYGLDVNYIQGIEKYPTLVPVPNTLSHIKGLINLRGDVIPVYSLRKKFGMPEVSATESTQLIVTVLKDNIPLAFEVDSVKEIKEINDTNEKATPALVMSGDTGYIKKVVQIDKNLAILLDPEGILNGQEKDSIKKYLDKMSEEEESNE